MDDFTVTIPADDPSFTMVRSFSAPQALIWECYTVPEHLKHFWGPHGSTNPVMEVDLRVGGVWRVVMRFKDGQEFGYSSVYLEITEPQQLVYRDAPYEWRGGFEGLPEMQLHTVIDIEPQGERTVVTVTVRAPTIAFRDDQIARGFTEMIKVGHERLEAYMEKLKSGGGTNVE